jgi:hypothetical protein
VDSFHSRGQSEDLQGLSYPDASLVDPWDCRSCVAVEMTSTNPTLKICKDARMSIACGENCRILRPASCGPQGQGHRSAERYENFLASFGYSRSSVLQR